MTTLVIGCGNDLRGDDAAGRVVAERIEALGRPDVVVRSTMQLVPELAIDLAAAERVFIVDAAIGVDEVVVQAVADRMASTSGLTHHVTPEVLLGLAEQFATSDLPEVEQISIPASQFAIGATMSPATLRGIDTATELIVDRLEKGSEKK